MISCRLIVWPRIDTNFTNLNEIRGDSWTVQPLTGMIETGSQLISDIKLWYNSHPMTNLIGHLIKD